MCKQNGLLARVLRYGIYVAFASDFVFFDLSSTYKCNFLGADNKQ